jgi:hypothetical protein
MPQPRKYIDDKARKRAYKERHREEVLEKKREAYVQKKKYECGEEADARKERQARNSKNYYHRKKIRLEAEKEAPQVAYKSRQSLGKAVCKAASTLPRSPRKKTAVLLSLLRKNGIDLVDEQSSSSQKVPWNKVSDEHVDMARKFFLSEEVSWTSPFAKDSMKIAGSTEKIARCYLVCSLREAHQIFQQKYPSIKIGFSKFCSLKPINVKINRDLPHLVCVCKYHENFRYVIGFL